MAEMPWFKFYPGDWLKDANLRRAGHAAKGFYADFLCIAYDCEERGVFATNGNPWTDEEVASAVSGDSSENLTLLRRLLELNIISRNETGAIISRRIVKDEAKRKSASENGKRGGGNPNFNSQAYQADLATKRSTETSPYDNGRTKVATKVPPKVATKVGTKVPTNLEVRYQISESRDQNSEIRDQIPDSEIPPLPPDGGSRPAEDRGDEIRAVFDHYRTYHPKAFRNPQSSSKEWRDIRKRLEEGYSVDDLKQAVDGCHVCPHNCGANDRNQKFQGLHLIVRTGDQVARFIDEWESRNAPVLSQKAQMTNRAAQSYLFRKGFTDVG